MIHESKLMQSKSKRNFKAIKNLKSLFKALLTQIINS